MKSEATDVDTSRSLNPGTAGRHMRCRLPAYDRVVGDTVGSMDYVRGREQRTRHVTTSLPLQSTNPRWTEIEQMLRVFRAEENQTGNMRCEASR